MAEHLLPRMESNIHRVVLPPYSCSAFFAVAHLGLFRFHKLTSPGSTARLQRLISSPKLLGNRSCLHNNMFSHGRVYSGEVMHSLVNDYKGVPTHG